MSVSSGPEATVFKRFWWNVANIFLDFHLRFCREFFFEVWTQTRALLKPSQNIPNNGVNNASNVNVYGVKGGSMLGRYGILLIGSDIHSWPRPLLIFIPSSPCDVATTRPTPLCTDMRPTNTCPSLTIRHPSKLVRGLSGVKLHEATKLDSSSISSMKQKLIICPKVH